WAKTTRPIEIARRPSSEGIRSGSSCRGRATPALPACSTGPAASLPRLILWSMHVDSVKPRRHARSENEEHDPTLVPRPKVNNQENPSEALRKTPHTLSEMKTLATPALIASNRVTIRGTSLSEMSRSSTAPHGLLGQRNSTVLNEGRHDGNTDLDSLDPPERHGLERPVRARPPPTRRLRPRPRSCASPFHLFRLHRHRAQTHPDSPRLRPRQLRRHRPHLRLPHPPRHRSKLRRRPLPHPHRRRLLPYLECRLHRL